MDLLREPITKRLISPVDSSQDQERWLSEALAFVSQLHFSDLPELNAQLYHFVNRLSNGERGERPRVPRCDHALDSYLPDHALLCSALVYCLAPEHTDLQQLRLAAMSHELPESARTELLTKLHDQSARTFLQQAWTALVQQGNDLSLALGSENSLATFAGRIEDENQALSILLIAHLAASQPLHTEWLLLEDRKWMGVIGKCADFTQHPLQRIQDHYPANRSRIGLVHGGAVKVKEYVFESAKLPEIRGASALLDHINQVEVRRLVNDAPECVIYANGGEALILWPADQAQQLAEQLEELYIEHTLSAQAAVVAAQYTLLELQYGLQPTRFWLDDYLAQLAQCSPEQRKIFYAYYGNPIHNEQKGWQDSHAFYKRKGFGELVTQLALKRQWRREANQGSWLDQPTSELRQTAFFETPAYGQFCTSCDRRLAVVQIPDLTDRLCEPCARKRWTGWVKRRKQNQSAHIFEENIKGWHPPSSSNQQTTDRQEGFDSWYREFEEYVSSQSPELKALYLHETKSWHDIDSPDNLDEIAQAAKPKGYIGLVYADGNNVGALISNIHTASAYRQFASRLFLATKAAVFEALANQLHPARAEIPSSAQANTATNELEWLHPFEIISIGGDDLFLIVPAEAALPIAHHIASFVEQCFANDDASYSGRSRHIQRYLPDSYQPTGKPQVSISAGVVMAANNTPIFFLKELVEDLLKSAKTGATTRRKEHYFGGMIDFMALKSLNMVTSNLGEFRRAALQDLREASQETLHLTARPYTAHEVAGLLKTVVTLRKSNFPKSQLYQLRELLEQGRFVSSLGYLYFSSRLKGDKLVLLREQLDQAWCLPTVEPVPWRRQPEWQNRVKDNAQDKDKKHTYWETILMDLMEIYDFVGEVENG